MLPGGIRLDFYLLKDLHLMFADDFFKLRNRVENFEVVVSRVGKYDCTGTHRKLI